MNDTLAARFSDLLTRAIVPAWVLAGAIFKLAQGTAKNLPKVLIDLSDRVGFSLDYLLPTLISLELLAAGVMIFLPRWSRAMAVFMLTAFCAILVVELSHGATNCGCFGNIKIHPGVTLAIDGSLLLAILLLWLKDRRRVIQTPRWAVLAAVVWILAGFGISFGRLAPRSDSQQQPAVIADNNHQSATQPTTQSTTQPSQPSQPQPTPRSVRKPPNTYLPHCEQWVGQRWEQIDIAQYMQQWPRDIEHGQHYVIFFQRTCEHCYELFQTHFIGKLSIPTTAVAIPEKKSGFETSGVQPWVCTECEVLELPTGCDWVITTPIVVAVENGVIVCAKEGDDAENPECLKWGTPAK